MHTLKKQAFCSILMLSMVFAGCDGSNSGQTTGIILGGASGALLGSMIKDSDGKTSGAAVGVGAVLGALVGSQIGSQMDKNDKEMAQDAAQKAANAPVGEEIQWSNQKTGHKGIAKTLKTGVDRDGNPCRQIEQQISIDGKTDVILVDICYVDEHWVVVS